MGIGGNVQIMFFQVFDGLNVETVLNQMQQNINR